MFSNSYRDWARIAPKDHPSAIGAFSSPDPFMAVGMAYPTSHVGGIRHDFNAWPIRSEWLGPPEVTWRLVVGKEELEGRFVLRMGEFIELGEDAL